jgi:hypothetical protein
MIIAIYTFCVVWTMSGLFAYHVMLIVRNETTHERVSRLLVRDRARARM